MNDQERMPLLEALECHKNEHPRSFHIPGHSYGKGAHARFSALVGEAALACDTTEAKGLDDYHDAAGVIAEAQRLAAELWGADETLFLVNGTTSGIMAAVAGVCGEDDEIIIQRNSHKSVVRALVVSGALPVWCRSVGSDFPGVPESVSACEVARLIEEHPGAKAVYLTDPTYQGVRSDLAGIVRIAHEKNIPVIVDEAHGAHLYFCKDAGPGALQAGADIVIQSTHKTAGSMTQSSMIHLQGDLIDKERVKEWVKMFQSTSPSYLLMASLDAARHNMYKNGAAIFEERTEWCRKLRSILSDVPGTECLEGGRRKDGSSGIFETDELRLVITAKRSGLTGIELDEILRERYVIEPEYSDLDVIVCVVGPGTGEDDIEALGKALCEIGHEIRDGSSSECNDVCGAYDLLPEAVMTPKRAFSCEYEMTPLNDCTGRIASSDITPYPPGIPLVVRGEVIEDVHVRYAEALLKEGGNVHGAEEEGSGDVFVKTVKDAAVGRFYERKSL